MIKPKNYILVYFDSIKEQDCVFYFTTKQEMTSFMKKHKISSFELCAQIGEKYKIKPNSTSKNFDLIFDPLTNTTIEYI